MKYFSGIEWVGFNHYPEFNVPIAKSFPDYTVLDYSHHGELYLQLDDGPVMHLKSPVAWFTFPGPVFKFWTDAGKSWDHRHIGFRGSRAQQWIRGGLLKIDPERPVIPVTHPERFVMEMDGLMAYLTSPKHGPARAVQMFEGLLLQLQEQQAVKRPLSKVETLIDEWIQRITDTPEAHWDAREEARRIGISSVHFRTVFHLLTGQPPQRYIVRQRMEKAARLLRENRLAIKEVALAAGYDDVFHFSKLFKRHMNASPGRFRARSVLT